LRRLTTETFPEALDTRILLCLDNLTSLQMFWNPQTLGALSFIGPRLKELSISEQKDRITNGYPVWIQNPFYDVLKVFDYCPNLECFVLLRFRGDVDLDTLADNSKLKKLVVEGTFYKVTVFLAILCRSPLLEEVKMDIDTSPIDLMTLTCLLKTQFILQIFQNVTTVEMYFRPRARDLTLFEDLAKNIVANCPKLQTARFYFDSAEPAKKKKDSFKYKTADGSVAPFMELVKRF